MSADRCSTGPVWVVQIQTNNIKWDVTVTGAQGQQGGTGARGPQGPPGGATLKSGVLMAGAFTGAPRTAAVVFDTPFDDATYVIAIAGVDSRLFTYSGKTANGFTINANSNGALLGEVSWTATGAVNP